MGKWNFPPQTKDRNSINENVNRTIELGNPELAKNKEIYSVLSDPEFIKAFPGPADFQYEILRSNFMLSPEFAQNSLAYLKGYLEKTDSPTFSLIRFSQFLHTALGNIKLTSNNQEQHKTIEILENGFKEISESPKMKYFLGVTLNPKIMLSRTQSFEGMERGLTPIQVSGGCFVQDNGFDPIPIFYDTDNPEEFNKVIEQQKKFFEDARPENRPELPKNATLKEMKEYKDKYLNSTINFKEKNEENKEKINSNVRRLTPQEIQKFFPDSHNTYELTQDPLMFEFRSFINPEIRRTLEKEFGISFNEIPLKVQMYFLTSIANRTNEAIRLVQDFTKKFKALGLRTFLSLEQGGKEMGDKILTLGEKLPEVVAKIVFAKYGEIIDTVDNIQKLLEDILPDKGLNESQKEVGGIKESLLVRAKNLLVTFYDKKENNSGELLKDLDRYKSEILLYADTYKKLRESGKEIKLEEIKNTKIEILSQEEKMKIANELWDITIANRPFIKDEKEIEKRKKDFFSTIDNKDSDFYVLRHKDKILAFCSFTLDENGELYAESLNTESEIKGAQIGGEFFPTVLEKVKNMGRDIYGHVHPLNFKILSYYERLGFIIKEIKDGPEVKYYEIRMPAQLHTKLAA